MTNCPNCGEPVGASATACSECGAPLEGVTDPSGGQPADGQAGDAGQPRQPDHPQGGQQPRQGQQPGQGQPPQGGQPNQQPGRGRTGRGGQGGQPERQPRGGQSSKAPQGGQPNRQSGGGQPNQQPQGGQPGRQPQGGQPGHGPQGGQPRQGGQQGQQPQGGQGYQQPAGQQQPGGQQYQGGGHPPGRRPPAGQGDGYDRRTLLKVGGGAAVLGGLGLVGYTLLGGSGGPVGTARSFVNALDNGNVERANELIHDDSPMGEFGAFTASTLEQVDITIEGTELVSENAGRAEVRVDLSVENAGVFGGGTSSATVELQTQNGQWRVWQFS